MELPKLNAKQLIVFLFHLEMKGRNEGSLQTEKGRGGGGYDCQLHSPLGQESQQTGMLPHLPAQSQPTALTYSYSFAKWPQHPVDACYTVNIQQVNANVSEHSEPTEGLWIKG